MNCPRCGRPSRVLATEERYDGVNVIKRMCTAPLTHTHPESVFETYEILSVIVRRVMPASAFQRVTRQARRGASLREQQYVREISLKKLAVLGLSNRELARRLDVTENCIRKTKARMAQREQVT